MTIWAIVPVKPFNLGKSRLAGSISEDDRINLNTKLLVHTLTTLAEISEISQVLVVSRDSNVLSISRDLGAKTVLENGSPLLNTALTRATVFAQLHAIYGVLILPADLPLLSKNDILSLIEAASNPPVVVISPDRRNEGTNALLISPAGLIEYDFGPNSFDRHCCNAKLAGARLEIVNLPSLAFDLDIPEDLQMLDKLKGLI
ncbi:MAG: 2-phospho-L-lactate guanylyltransferase [Chloroflexota bacterium]